MEEKLIDETAIEELEEGTISITFGANIYSVRENGNIVSVKGLSIAASGFPLVIEEGQAMPTGTLTVTLVGVEGTITWSVQDASIATLSANEGTEITVTAVAPGETVVTATCGDSSNTYTVVVNEPEPELLSSVVNVGDYIRYDAGSKAFSMTTEQTGVTGDAQNYNTGTYTGLWRVRSVDNTTGKVQIISVTDVTNGTGFKLYGKTGALRYVETLDSFCSNYVNSAYAESARSIGGSGVSVITEDSLPTTQEKHNTTVSIDGVEDIFSDFTWISNYAIGGQTGSYHACYYAERAFVWGAEVDGGNYVNAIYLYYTGGWYKGKYNAGYGSVSLLGGESKSNVGDAFTWDWERQTSFGVVPVVTLKSQVSVASGTGDDTDPYVLNPVQ